MAWNAVNTDAVEVELTRRGALTATEWRHVRSKSVAIGMSKVAVICSWGPIYAGVNGSVNTTVSNGSVFEQRVYRDTSYSKAEYVYLTNGVVTSIQY